MAHCENLDGPRALTNIFPYKYMPCAAPGAALSCAGVSWVVPNGSRGRFQFANETLRYCFCGSPFSPPCCGVGTPPPVMRAGLCAESVAKWLRVATVVMAQDQSLFSSSKTESVYLRLGGGWLIQQSFIYIIFQERFRHVSVSAVTNLQLQRM